MFKEIEREGGNTTETFGLQGLLLLSYSVLPRAVQNSLCIERRPNNDMVSNRVGRSYFVLLDLNLSMTTVLTLDPYYFHIRPDT